MLDKKKKEIFELVRKLAIIYEKDLSSERHRAYVEFLRDYEVQTIAKVFADCMRSIKFFPSLAEIIEKIEQPLTAKEDANEMAGEIIKCISRFGYTNELAVKEALGPVASLAIDRVGGWLSICKTNNSELSTLRAQLRDTCSSAIKVNKRIEKAKKITSGVNNYLTE